MNVAVVSRLASSTVLSRLFPDQIDNQYRGLFAALLLLFAYLLVKAFACVNAIGLNPLWTSRAVLEGVEAVPLQGFDPIEANATLLLFAWWGVAGLAPTLLGLLAIARYRSMIPLIYLLMLASKGGEVLVAEDAAIVGMLGAGAPAPFIVLGVLMTGFILSLVHRK